jgi:hypothetical protein
LRSCRQLAVGPTPNCQTYLQRLLLGLNNAQSVHLLPAFLVELLDRLGGFLDRLLVLGRADDVFQILEQTILVLVARLGLHLRNALHLALCVRFRTDLTN